MANHRKTLPHVKGCFLGGAIGDALGAPVEFLSLAHIRNSFGTDGIQDFQPAYDGIGCITDDTQMTLFTAEGLILSHVRKMTDQKGGIVNMVYQAYLRWLSTQKTEDHGRMIRQYGTCIVEDGLLTANEKLFSRRAPGNACISSLSTGWMGSPNHPVNDSKGCGGVMRIAPVGYFCSSDTVFPTACEIAAITHGHPTGYLAAGFQAQLIHAISNGLSLPDAVRESISVLKFFRNHEEVLRAVENALNTHDNKTVSFETVESLGGGWVAEEALAIGIYCALCAGDDFEKGVWLAVNHGGDSDSTGAITGNILGALLGETAIPEKYLKDLELKEVIEELATDLYERMPGSG